MPRPPDCDENPTRPRTGGNGANVAFIEISGSALITPMQLGPIIRAPASRTRARSWRSSALDPSLPPVRGETV